MRARYDRAMAFSIGAAVYCAATGPALGQYTIHVDLNASCSISNGTADYPYCTIQEGIYASNNEDVVLVHPGVYRETLNFGSKKIELRSTDGPTDTWIEGGAPGENITVVTIEGDQGRETVLEGFTITGATTGGGVRCVGASPVIRNNVITGNTTTGGKGGGIFLSLSNALITECVISCNTATALGDAQAGGGGIYTEYGNVMIVRCLIEGNKANRADDEYSAQFPQESDGGGILIEGSDLETTDIYNSVIRGNEATGDGGGIGMDSPELRAPPNRCLDPGYTNHTLKLVNTLITCNSAGFRGGGLFSGLGITSEISNCTLAMNEGGIDPAPDPVTGPDCDSYVGGAVHAFCSPVTIDNSILWDNTASCGHELSVYLTGTPGPMEVSYSTVPQGTDDISGPVTFVIGNIQDDPHFLDPKCSTDTCGDDDDGDFRLETVSPAIDSGNNGLVAPDKPDLDDNGNTAQATPLDLDDLPRFVGNVDMGAYELQPWGEIVEILYVDKRATGAPPYGNGLTWFNAFRTVQDALALARDNPDFFVSEIWVAEGTYNPDEGEGVEAGDRSVSFELVHGVVLKGGFAGNMQQDPNERDIHRYVTILSGDLAGNDIGGVEFLACYSGDGWNHDAGCEAFNTNANEDSDVDEEDGNREDNSYHVVSAQSIVGNPGIDGFTITAGWADGLSHTSGGGLYSANTSLNINACTFTENFCSNRGGGVYIKEDASANMVNCVFNGNLSRQWGGGACVYSGTVTNTQFSGNLSLYGAGLLGAYSDWTPRALELTNCTFAGNSAALAGGGAIVAFDTEITNCIFWGNTSPSGAQVYEYTEGGPPQASVTYSCVEGGWGGLGNSGVDPKFVDAVGPDQLAGTSDDVLSLLPSSESIDAGDPNFASNGVDIAGNPRVHNGRVDRGAYEFQGVYYVDANATGAFLHDGLTWCTAFNSLENALDVVEHGESAMEIRVADGTYYPPPCLFDFDPNATFHLLDGVTIEGGYAGCGAVDPDERNFTTHISILSPSVASGQSGYRRSIVTSIDNDRTAILDGFTITGAAAMLSGGGMLCTGSPTIRNCTFVDNRTYYGSGGGMGIGSPGSAPLITNCVFKNNHTGSYHGGGVYISNTSQSPGSPQPVLIDCIFEDNTAPEWGGGMMIRSSAPILINCRFSGNRISGGGPGSVSHGGGLALSNFAAPELYNCLFYDNFARKGGGIYASTGSKPKLVNCTLAGNGSGREMFIENAFGYGTHADVYNTIFWNGGSGGEILGGQLATIEDSLCSSSLVGCTYYEDPDFVDPAGRDYRLQAESPCVDAGLDSWLVLDDDEYAPFLSLDLDRKPRFVDVYGVDGRTVDMGAYEYQLPPPSPVSNCVNDSECDDGVECTADVCDAGSCSYSNVPDGTLCTDDGVACTDDVCSAGTCTHPNAASGTACDDGLFCTETDECDGNGTCVGSGAPCSFKFQCCEVTNTCICKTCVCLLPY